MSSTNGKNASAELAKKKYLAVKRAERRLRNRLADLDWEHEVLKPELEALDRQIIQGSMPTFELVEENVSENQ